MTPKRKLTLGLTVSLAAYAVATVVIWDEVKGKLRNLGA